MNKNSILSWIEEGVIAIPSFLFSNYKKIGLTDMECMFLLHIHAFINKGIEFPTSEQISERMLLSVEQCAQMIGSLIHRGYLSIIKGNTETGIYYEKYSLKPLWERIIDSQSLIEKKDEEVQQKNEEGALFSIFEQEFARPLSPMEREMLTMWIDHDHHKPTVIKAALKEAVISGKMNFRYIDRILFEWKKNGVQTVEQAYEYAKKFRKPKQKQPTEDKRSSEAIPFYNWLES